jgi:hypothetical protein
MNTIKLELNSINLVATWKYSSKNIDCICKRPLHLPTVNEIDRNNISTDNVIIGECGHAMHKSCIEAYFKTCDNICPIDKLEWKYVTEKKPKYHIV